MVPNAQQVIVVTEVKVQLVTMAMSSYQMNDLDTMNYVVEPLEYTDRRKVPTCREC